MFASVDNTDGHAGMHAHIHACAHIHTINFNKINNYSMVCEHLRNQYTFKAIQNIFAKSTLGFSRKNSLV